ncbi:hypothetical protein FQN60_005145 [Etheostoma spectabile]|uniref:Uncharacterized protein n=1 Tax=Etheostoma spectabile TaxID=54343 RepID=A0A5J5DLT0_9PERO|nr:hypothetical protein FQN60_005145 [Etheostoma spectabile]
MMAGLMAVDPGNHSDRRHTPVTYPSPMLFSVRHLLLFEFHVKVLPPDIRTVTDVALFRSKLKTYRLSLAFNT